MINLNKKNIINVLFILLIFYFILNLIGGERGLISLIDKNYQLEELMLKNEDYSKKINDYEKRIDYLTKNINLDFIEILIRDKFLFGKNGEKIYIITNNEN